MDLLKVAFAKGLAITPKCLELSELKVSIPTTPIKFDRVGLVNRSSTNMCFMNAAIQALFSVPIFVRYILAMGHIGSVNVYPTHYVISQIFHYLSGIRSFEKIKGKQPVSLERNEKIIEMALSSGTTDFSSLREVKEIKPQDVSILAEPIMEKWLKIRDKDEQQDSAEFLEFIISGMGTELGWGSKKKIKQYRKRFSEIYI